MVRFSTEYHSGMVRLINPVSIFIVKQTLEQWTDEISKAYINVRDCGDSNIPLWLWIIIITKLFANKIK